MNKTALDYFFFGLSFGSGPCMASCGTLLISYLAGTGQNIKKSIYVYVVFTLARIIVYVVLSLFIFKFGQIFIKRMSIEASRYIYIFGGLVMVLTGALIIFGRHWGSGLKIWIRERFIGRDNVSVALLGIITGLIPCGPLIVLLSYIGLVSKSSWQSCIFSLSFGMGTLFSPLAILCALTGLLPRILGEKREFYSRIFSVLGGIIIIVLGIEMIARVF